MKKIVAITILTLLVGFVPDEVCSQFRPDFSAEQSMYRQLDAMRWDYGISISENKSAYFFLLDNRFQSRLFLMQGKAQNIQDENQFRFRSGYHFQKSWTGLVEADSYRFTTTDIRQEFFRAGIRYNPFQKLEIDALAGILTDSRSGETDRGPFGTIRVQSDWVHIGEIGVQPRLYLERAEIEPRVQQSLGSRLQLRANWDEIRLRATTGWGSSVREGYQPSSFFNRDLPNIIESIRSDTLFTDVETRFPVTATSNGFLDIYYAHIVRTVEGRRRGDLETQNQPIFDTEAVRSNLNIRTGVEMQPGRHFITSGVDFRYQSRESGLINTEGIPSTELIQRSRQLQNSNFEQSRLELFVDSRLDVSSRTDWLILTRYAIFRYDTPEINLDDRDEQSYLVVSNLIHRFSPFFRADFQLAGEATHLVYLSGQRSIENNWRRSLRLMPAFHWQISERLMVYQVSLIRANYTVQDFALPGRPVSDQASREFVLEARAEYDLAQDWQLSARVSRSELRIGRLFWETFQEIPTDTLVTWDGELTIGLEKNNMRIKAGARYFLKRDYLARATLQAFTGDADNPVLTRTGPGLQFTHQVGPVIDALYRFDSGNIIMIQGWLQYQLVNRRLYMAYPDDVRPVFMAAENRYDRRIYPNIHMTVSLKI